ncbi:MAG: ABC transporter substrate-binding protein [Oscillospiraceae bacterium]|jgi:polar amino acid transport system substrate-binding protein|nr:ABC transporter substrate-binding protein [Oscillospiraceae bacterium]
MRKLLSITLVLLMVSMCAAALGETASLPTLTPGKLTIGTGEPAWEPWVLNDAPETGEGFEAALAYAVAERLGFAAEDVVWVRTQFEEAIQPGPKSFDFNLQQYSVTEPRRAAVDFSSVYYREPLAVVVKADGPFAKVASIADLKDAVFGAASGDIAVSFTQENIKPTQQVQVFNDLAAVAQALNAGQIDAMVAGVTTADYLTYDQVEGGVVAGVLAGSELVTDGLALVLDKDSPLTDAVTAAVDSLLADGSIDALKTLWLGQYDVPTLE